MPNHRFPLTGPIELSVRVGHGAVTVEAADDVTEATVDIVATNGSDDLLGQTTVELAAGTLTIAAPRQGGIFDLPMFGRRSHLSLDVHVRVPSGTPVRVATFTAPITIIGRIGRADLAFGAARADIAEVDGDLRLRYGNGTIKVGDVTGSVQLRSGSGEAEIASIGQAFMTGCGSGRVQVGVVRGAVHARCGAGTLVLRAVHDDVDVASGSGDLTIGLPAGRSVHLDVSTGAGRLDSELPIEDAPRSPKQAIKLRARTGLGNIRLMRAA